eukprot:6706210-Pyramimonas_sp.AAC.1
MFLRAPRGASSSLGHLPTRGNPDPGQSGLAEPCEILQDPAPEPGSGQRILQDPAGSCTQRP